MKKKPALLLARSIALDLTACGGGNKVAETMATPETITAVAVEAAREENRGDAAEITAVEATDGDMDAFIEAAKAEGELTVYGSCEEGCLFAVRRNFERLYEIKAKYQRLPTSEVYTEISEEADRPSADIWFGGTTDPYNEAAAGGLLMEHDAINAKNLVDDQYRDPTNCWYGIYKDTLGFMVDTKELGHLGLEAPETWDDPAKGECKGLIMLSSPNTASTAKLLINTMVQMEGHDEIMEYFKVLDKNISQYTKSGFGLPKMVDPGGCVIDIGLLHDGTYQIPQDYDSIQLIVPEDGTSFKIGATAIFDGRIHPNAAKLWIGYALSPDCMDHAKGNGSYQFLALSNATQPEEATELGLDIDNTTDYDFEDTKENSAKYIKDSFVALGSSSDGADSSRFLTEQVGLLPVSGTWKHNVV